MSGKREHYNSPTRYSAPWIDAGLVKTRTAGTRRVWLHAPTGTMKTWTAAIAGEGSTCGDTREQALERAKNW
jgi:hypothetical protein